MKRLFFGLKLLIIVILFSKYVQAQENVNLTKISRRVDAISLQLETAKPSPEQI